MNEQQPYSPGPPPQAQARRLYKSRREKMIDGVCGGIAEYFDVDPTIVRILWVLLTLAGGSGFILYIAAMIVMPANPEHLGAQTTAVRSNFDHKRFWGLLLILMGAFFLTTNLGILGDFSWWRISWKVLFPCIIIASGAILVMAEMRKRQQAVPPVAPFAGSESAYSAPIKKELRRSIIDKKIFGVCGGIANYFEIDSTLVRIVYLVLILASFGWGLLLYVILTLLMPEDKPSVT